MPNFGLTLLEWALGDRSWAVRLAVAKALGERGNQETIPKLKRHPVRYMAAASIVKLGLKKSSQASGARFSVPSRPSVDSCQLSLCYD